MGLIKAGLTALNTTLADQWKEFFYCDALDKDTLMVKGLKRTSAKSSNKGSDNIISNGSGIAVADGQCMIIVEQGKVVDICAEPGQYTYDRSSEPSVFTGKFGEALKESFKVLGRRFTYGGDTGKDQRVYYFNTKEILDNKFGTPNPIPFRIVDKSINLDIDMEVRCNGVYSYRISDPIIFYTNVCGNVTEGYERGEIDSQLKTEFVNALQPAFAALSEQQMRPNQIPAHAQELCDLMNGQLTAKWGEARGLAIVSIAMNPITLTEEDMELIKRLQKSAALRDPSLAAGTLVGAQADAMVAAAENENGAMAGLMGMGMAMNVGGSNAQNLYAMGNAAPAAGGWKCSCGAVNTGKFCSECGAKKPEADAWKCSCGTVNTGKFCSECGAKKPEAGTWKCSCGTVNTGKFCSDCGAKKPE